MKLMSLIIGIPALAFLFTMITIAGIGNTLTAQLFGNTVEELWLGWIVILSVLKLIKSIYSHTKYKQG